MTIATKPVRCKQEAGEEINQDVFAREIGWERRNVEIMYPLTVQNSQN